MDLRAATLDELVPRSRGGTDEWGNVVMSCEPCNKRRGDTMPPMWALYLVRLREAWRVPTSAIPSPIGGSNNG